MTQRNIPARVHLIIMNELDVEEEQLTPEANIKDDLGADSLDKIELVMALEDEFFITIPDELIDTILTVQDAITFVEERAGGKQIK